MIRQQINDQMKEAMRARDSVRLNTLRYIYSEIKNHEIDVKHELNDQEVIDLLFKEVKRRNDAIDQFKKAGRVDLSTKELEELAIINVFMPKLMDREALAEVVKAVAASNPGVDFGGLMKLVMLEVKGKADGKLVSEMVREIKN